MGDFTGARAHFDESIALYDPAEHRPYATRFGQDARVSSLSWRSCALWALGYSEATLADVHRSLRESREIGHAPTLMTALSLAVYSLALCRDYATASELNDELVALTKEKGTEIFHANAMALRGYLFALDGNALKAVEVIRSAMAARQATGATLNRPTALSYLAYAHARLGKFDEAWRCLAEAVTFIETKGERWFDAEELRIGGEIALLEPNANATKAEAYFNRALDVARKQQAKSWELRAATSMARLWRDQGKREEACDLLAPVYGWFTEGFDTLDLKEAKVLLDELAA
jgi:predicted ATPase